MKIGVTELLIILAVVVIIFGPTQIPKLTKMLGKSVRNFRKGMTEDDKADADEKEGEVLFRGRRRHHEPLRPPEGASKPPGGGAGAAGGGVSDLPV